MNDKTLRQNVVDELDFDPSLDSANIGVAARDGVVTLSGHVPSFTQKFGAERAAWRVKGVKAIAQELDVRIPGEKQVDDDQIARRAIKILEWSADFPHTTIRVKVTGGWVTLSGEVEWDFQRKAAEAAVRKLSGIVTVINEIALSNKAKKLDIQKHIAEALARHAAFEASRIQVEVREDGEVTIAGEVADWNEREAVERAVWSTPGVISVDDRLRIG